ncbi:hypothetical protein pb186bvf_008664 [Paramecium bursaria]
MNSTQRKFVRCFNCNSKPATVKCFDCNTNEAIKLCYHCDADIHHDLEHQKQIIPYDQMVDQTRSITPNKENHQSAPRSPQAHSRSDSQNLSSILRSKIKKNSDDVQNQSVINEDYMSIQKTQLKSVELKFRIKFQEQENTINLLKQHIENIEQKHKDNISKMREQVIKAQDDAYQKTEEAHSEVNKVRRIYEDKINGYVAQLESEAQFNNQLQIKLDDLRLTHQNKVSELQQQISQLRSDIERRKLQEEKLQIDCENQIIQAKQDLQKDYDKQFQMIKQDSNSINEDWKQKIQHKQELINDLQNQIQQLQSTLRDVDVVWQKKLNYEQIQNEDIRNKYNMIKEECDLLHKENKHLQSEILIYQKENELFQKEKLNLTKQLNSIQEKNEKLDRFIYGARKSKSRY